MTNPESRSARASLDAWLRSAEELIATQREQSISPSFVEAIAANSAFEASLKLSDLTRGLPSLLERMVLDPGRWILVVEFGPKAAGYYGQLLVYEDGSLFTEVVSNNFLEAPFLLDEAGHHELGLLGWTAPVPPRRPNWSVAEETRNPDVDATCRRMVDTLVRVFGVATDESVRCKLFSSPRRGGTPASERSREEPPDQPRAARTAGPERAPRHQASSDQARSTLASLNRLAGGAGMSWILVSGLLSEIEKRGNPDSPIPDAAIKALRDRAHEASLRAHVEAMSAQACANAGRSDEIMEKSRRVAIAAEEAGEAARLMAQLALGVFASEPSTSDVERLDRAAVEILIDRELFGCPDDFVVFAADSRQLLPEVAGILCRVLCESRVGVQIGPARIWCDQSGTLHVVVGEGVIDDGAVGCSRAERVWASPVVVLEPAKFVVGALEEAGVVLPPVITTHPAERWETSPRSARGDRFPDDHLSRWCEEPVR